MQEHTSSQRQTSVTEDSANNSPSTTKVPTSSDRHKGDSIGSEQLEQFFLLSVDLLCIAGFDGYFKYLNPAWSKTFGYTEAELLAKPYLEFVHPEDRSATIAEAQKLENGCEVINFQNRYGCKDGTYRWLSWNTKLQPEQQLAYCIAHDITESKQKEQALQESEYQLRLAFDAARMGSWNWNIKTGQIKWSNNLETLFGLAPGEFDGSYELFVSSIYSEDRDRVLKAIENAVATGADYETEFRIVYPNGQIRWALSKGKVFYDANGQPMQMAGVDLDITERKQLEQQLKQQEERWQLALQGNNDGIWDWNLQTNEVFFSARWKSMLGYEEHEISNYLDEWSKRVHPDDLEATIQDIQNHLARNTDYYINEHRVQCKDGSYKWILDRGKALWDEAGNPLRMVGSHTDITDRKEAEAKEHQLKIALENAVEGIAFLDSQGCYRQVNQAYAKMTGYSPEEMIGMNWEVTVHPEDLEKMRTVSSYQQILRNGKVEAEAKGVRKDGSIFYKQVMLISAYGEDRQRIGHYCFMKNITYRKQMEERLRLLESVVVHANDAVLIAEVESIDRPRPKIVYVNDAFQRITGYTLEELQGKTTDIFQGTKTQRSKLDKIDRALKNFKSVRVELINYRKDGSEFWTEINLTPVADEKDRYTHWVSVQRDITERKQAEEKLQAQRLRSQLFAEITLKIRQSLQLQDILKTTVSEIQNLLDADRVLILRLEAPKTLYVIQETVRTGWDSVLEQGFSDDCLDEEYLIKYPQGRLYSILDVDQIEENECLIKFLRQFQVKSKLVIPLLLHEKLWGMIVIHQCSHVRNWNELEINLLKKIANQIAIALGQSYLLEALANFSLNLKQLHRINTTSYSNSEDLFKDYLITGCSMFGMSTGIISKIAGESYQIQAVQSQLQFLEVGLEFSLKDTYCAAVIEEKRTITYTRVGKIESMQTHPVYQTLKLESYIGTPIFVNGQVYGTLNFSSLEARAERFQTQELEIIELMAENIGKLIATDEIEQQRQQAEKALQKSEQRWATLAQLAPVGIFLTDEFGNCSYVNQCWSEISGMTLPNASGQGWVNALHPEDRDRVLTEWYHAAQNHLSFRSEYRFIRPDGKITWVYGQAIAETTADGSVTGYIGTLTDITERLEIEKIKRALEREQELSELKLRFFSMASHEFRTPLSTIMFAAQVLENSEPEWLDAKKLRNLRRIKDNIQKITQMLTDVLMLARAEAKKLEFKPKALNLEQFCQQILEEIKTTRPENCQISFVYQGNHNHEIELDEKLLHSILINLLSNAIKYSPQGEEINFDVKLEARSVIFTIKDRGIGIPLPDQTNLFEAFHRGENVGNIEGTGLGLAIVKRCVDLQRGQITWDSYPGKGTTFIVSIPIISK